MAVHAAAANSLATSATKSSFSTTIAGWFKLDALASFQSFFAIGTGTDIFTVDVSGDDAGAFYVFADSLGTEAYICPLTAGKWYWVGFRVDGSGNMQGFIGSLRRDGTAVVYFSPTIVGANITTIIRVFTDHLGLDAPGACQNLMVWASSRTDQQITDAAVIGYDPVAAGTSPWAWWPLAASTDITDHSGNGRNLAVTGSVTTVAGPTVPPRWTGRNLAIKCVGNSATAGYPHDYTEPTYPGELQTLRPTDTVENLGHTGNTTNDLLGYNATTLVNDLFYTLGHDNLILFMEQTNDANVDVVDATTILARLNSYCRRAHALGFDIILTTSLPYTNGFAGTYTHNTVNDSVNTSLRGGAWQGADLVVDIAGDHFWDDTTDTAVYSDGAHPADAARAHFARNWNGAIATYLALVSSMQTSVFFGGGA